MKICKRTSQESNVKNVHLPDEFHDYGFSKRKAAYKFFAEHLGLNFKALLNDKGRIDESSIHLLPIQDLKVFPEKSIVFMEGWSYKWSDVYLESLEVEKKRNTIKQN